ncbi:hypothetical protein EDD27_3616 [Nonomuraea polychroma]|uniref:Uncharacterized protein n=1 Tax=Nonomuraea polychroma TaxID=46176 RepID=A0A438M5L5_9ACTN|nr:hypothetical protein [Nonomuraea polychroma]RVX41146.1 hypothetical protein EDD27_3616 [Nonomuraea polychroma]
MIEALDGHEEAANYRAEGTPRIEFDVARTSVHDHIRVALWSIRDDGIRTGGLDVCAVLSPANARNLRDALNIALGES